MSEDIVTTPKTIEILLKLEKDEDRKKTFALISRTRVL